MERFAKASKWRVIVSLTSCLLVSGCISVPTGTTHLYRKANAANVGSPAAQRATGTDVFDESLFINAVDNNLTIRKSGTDEAGSDVFAIYLSDGYFKYLKDIGGVNEVVVVAEFTETSAGTESDTVTRILGPYFGVADEAKTPFLNKLLYGPKPLESDHLNMKLTVLEYDQGENENSAVFLDFIQSVTQTLSLANPVTAAEQVFAKEIAKSLLSLNKDDVVMEIDLNFTGNAGDLASMEYNGSYIPLNVGDYVLINREHCVPANCYFQFTEEGNYRSLNPFAWIGDIAMLVPAGIRRGWADTPDGSALADIETSDFNYDNHRLTKTKKDSNDPDASLKPYIDKTWLSLSIVRGGDASLWQKRKLLTQAESSIQNLIKIRGGALVASQNYQIAEQALKDAKDAEILSKSGVTFASPLPISGNFTPTTGDDEYCLYHSHNVREVTASFYRLDSNEVPQQLSPADISKNTTKLTPNNTCFTIAPTARAVGEYFVVAAYRVGSEILTQKLRYNIEK